MKTWHCDECDGTNILIQTWTNPNTGKTVEGSCDSYCDDCNAHVRLTPKEEETP